MKICIYWVKKSTQIYTGLYTGGFLPLGAGFFLKGDLKKVGFIEEKYANCGYLSFELKNYIDENSVKYDRILERYREFLDFFRLLLQRIPVFSILIAHDEHYPESKPLVIKSEKQVSIENIYIGLFLFFPRDHRLTITR